MRGIYTNVYDARKKVYREIARLSYEYEESNLDNIKDRMEQIPYDIIPGEVSNFRADVFLDRAIIRERMRLAMGLPLRSANEMAAVSQGVEEAVKSEKYYQPPLIDVIKFACHACPDNVVHVTEVCQGCLARSCQAVCPKDAVKFNDRERKSYIDQDACIKCGRCIEACSYHAIVR